ncbi:MAG: hypothetical protein BCS36_05835 [Desulfovibrio sp. MES5]|uniref:class I SAM-dependent methyltransferase n=1 Tax=Desulfovibrio sp. MES5 TaxID=1899016 RepID=UPI000B9C8773|nr:class I SAM-dependent methyltransferase [Desulfovibrio sp. MES5]OXS29787.1 MAG: hypothetical protein BCS36_05835 [Desulfovibrio sp. MES5]
MGTQPLTLCPGGCISLHCYTGHEGGAEEAQAPAHRVRTLSPRRWWVMSGLFIWLEGLEPAALMLAALADADKARTESLLLVERLPVKAPQRP